MTCLSRGSLARKTWVERSRRERCKRRVLEVGFDDKSRATCFIVCDAEIIRFSKLSSKWWDENGEFGLMNPVQLEFVRQKLLEAAYDDGTIRPVHIIHSVDCKYLMSVAEVSCLG